MSKVIVVGSANTDLTVKAERLPRPGETVTDGALAGALAARKPLSQAICFASAAGALSTTRRGAQESLPTKKDIERFLEEKGARIEER